MYLRSIWKLENQCPALFSFKLNTDWFITSIYYNTMYRYSNFLKYIHCFRKVITWKIRATLNEQFILRLQTYRSTPRIAFCIIFPCSVRTFECMNYQDFIKCYCVGGCENDLFVINTSLSIGYRNTMIMGIFTHTLWVDALMVEGRLWSQVLHPDSDKLISTASIVFKMRAIPC